METDKNAILHEIKKDASEQLSAMKDTLQGLLTEIRSGQTRQFDTSDFVINEFRQLVQALGDLTDQLKRLP